MAQVLGSFLRGRQTGIANFWLQHGLSPAVDGEQSQCSSCENSGCFSNVKDEETRLTLTLANLLLPKRAQVLKTHLGRCCTDWCQEKQSQRGIDLCWGARLGHPVSGDWGLQEARAEEISGFQSWLMVPAPQPLSALLPRAWQVDLSLLQVPVLCVKACVCMCVCD